MGSEIFCLLFFGESLNGRLQLLLEGVKQFVPALYFHPKNARRKIIRKKTNAFRAQRQRRRYGANGTHRFAQSTYFHGWDAAEKFQRQMKLFRFRPTNGVSRQQW